MNPTETDNKNKNEEREEVQRDMSRELLDWLQEFRENLVAERSPLEPQRNPEPGYRYTSSSSHASPMELRAKVERVRVSMVSTRTFRRTQIAISA